MFGMTHDIAVIELFENRSSEKCLEFNVSVEGN